MATPAAFLRLPPELMLRVSTHLNTIDLGSYRLTCKQIETNLFESFAREFFSKRQFMVEQVSLEALVGIANHKTLAPYLKEVIISTDQLRVSGSQSSQYINRPTLLATGIARDLLVEAFSKLQNLRIVGLRDYDGRGRNRDGDGASWRSYGWRLAMPNNNQIYPSRDDPNEVFSLILVSLAAALAKPPNLEIFLRRTPLHDISFNVSGVMARAVHPTLHGLRTLLLTIDDRPSALGGDALPNLRNFLQHAPLLEHLRLNFRSAENTVADGFLSWLALPPGPDPGCQAATNTRLERLTRLELGMLTTSAPVLLGVIRKFALKSLSLWKVRIAPCGGDDDGDDDSMWADFLSDLANALQQPDEVQSMTIGMPSEVPSGLPSRHFYSVRFSGSIIDPKTEAEKLFDGAEKQASYRKHFDCDVSEWLRGLGLRAFRKRFVDVGGRQPMEYTSSDEGGSDSEENDDDDDDDSMGEESE